MVKTESTSKDLFDSSVNRFFVKGQESIYYTYNNGKLASDPKLACQNFVNALERIPKVIESHEKEIVKTFTPTLPTVLGRKRRSFAHLKVKLRSWTERLHLHLLHLMRKKRKKMKRKKRSKKRIYPTIIILSK